jgi:hypothetical protein
MFTCFKCSKARMTLTTALLAAAAQIGLALIISGTV